MSKLTTVVEYYSPDEDGGVKAILYEGIIQATQEGDIVQFYDRGAPSERLPLSISAPRFISCITQESDK